MPSKLFWRQSVLLGNTFNIFGFLSVFQASQTMNLFCLVQYFLCLRDYSLFVFVFSASFLQKRSWWSLCLCYWIVSCQKHPARSVYGQFLTTVSLNAGDAVLIDIATKNKQNNLKRNKPQKVQLSYGNNIKISLTLTCNLPLYSLPKLRPPGFRFRRFDIIEFHTHCAYSVNLKYKMYYIWSHWLFATGGIQLMALLIHSYGIRERRLRLTEIQWCQGCNVIGY